MYSQRIRTTRIFVKIQIGSLLHHTCMIKFGDYKDMAMKRQLQYIYPNLEKRYWMTINHTRLLQTFVELGINSYRQRGTDILKKLYFRFIAYFTTGLFIFLVYFITLFILLNQLIYPEDSHKFLYVIDSSIIYFPSTLIFTFCFITGGILFCLFLVRPLYLIISSISNLSRGNYTISEKAFTKMES